MSKYLNRLVKETKTFKVDGTFQSYYAAQKFLTDNGYECGSMCHPLKEIAVTKGEYNLPEKWKNFTAKNKQLIDGVMLSNDWREGEVKVLLFN